MSSSAPGPDHSPPAASAAPEVAAPRSLLDELRLGVVLANVDGRITVWSPETAAMLGWPEQRAVSRPVTDFLTDPAHVRRAPQILAELLRTGAWRGVLPLRHQDGSTVQLECRASVLTGEDGAPFILASLVETGRVRVVEQDLAALDALVSTSPVGIALFDTERRFTRVNEAMLRLYGDGSPELTGRTVLDVLPAPVSHELYEIQRQVLETGRSVVDLVTLSPDRQGARSVSFGRLTDRTGRTIGISCVVIDITERREALEKVEQARQRLALLDDVGTGIGDRLDVRSIAEAVAHVLVPRSADYAALFLRRAVEAGGDLPGDHEPEDAPMRLAGLAAKRQEEAVDRMLRAGEDLSFDSGSGFARVLTTGNPWLVATADELRAAADEGNARVQAALDLGVHSAMVVPLRARGTVLGLLVLARAGQRAAYGEDDLALAREMAARAGVSLDNARLYARERQDALMLQRSLLPPHVPEPPGVRVGYRYVPGSSGTEVGGDWFDVIPLAGGRTALVIGDVMGHGLHAAATMGRLRSAVRTLAALDLPPAALLRRVNELSDDLSQGPGDLTTATCVYAVYDPGNRVCVLATAGHVPPLLLTRSETTGHWRTDPVELEHGPPFGVADAEYHQRQVPVPDGAILALYTDGLVERRDEDLTDGIDRLRAVLSQARGEAPDLEELCDSVLRDVSPGSGRAAAQADDIALLTARLGGPDHATATSWTFTSPEHASRRARVVVRRTLRQWELEALTDTAVLLASELVSNAVRYARGPVGLRLVRGRTLLVEVSDPQPDPPVLRPVDEQEDSGRGLLLVSRSSHRWGTRQGPIGKTVWFELRLPG